MDTKNTETISVLMLPWLAHGHISPYVDLAKKLCTRNFNIYLCSTPVNLNSIKKNVTGKWSNLIHLVELNLPSMPDLPPHYHTTNGLPPHLMTTLETAFANSSPEFEKIFQSVKPDLLIYDYNQPWAADIALSNNIPAVQYVMSSAIFSSLLRHKLYCDSSVSFPFPLSIHKYFTEKMKARLDSSPDVAKEIDREASWQDIPQDTSCWATSSRSPTSEYFLSKEEIQEIASGLELSNLNFIWVVRFPFGENMKLEEALPLGFLDKVGDRGLVIEGWAPQAKILNHSSTGGFVSHCGWSSIMESMMFGVPVIAMPMHIDQPFNAVVVKEVGVGQEVERDENGRFNREEIAKVIRNVVLEKSGETVRRKAKEMREKIKENGEKEIDEVVEELVKLCREKKDETTPSKMLRSEKARREDCTVLCFETITLQIS
ncbi:beta-D-glucosyl crocetin beta-1,6-glucosyltransferase-like [Heracleum sosnowskyi]|uniref:Glycosyltransferase n=1 Tax=Heracleum sosnowskyi TaxID=360622 RepID=A0AAD8LWH5_9APIA|nr:beta-D-glucosyl crocetin beta-1,6-glucosyltransferase-like [Heracleum sosnowskyi]